MRRTWTKEEETDALLMSQDAFLTKYPDRTQKALRLKVEGLTGLPYSQFIGQRNLAGDYASGVLEPPPYGQPHIDEPPSEEQLEEFFQTLETTAELYSDIRPGQKTTVFHTPPGETIGVCVISDIHAGARGVRYDLFKRDLELIANTDGLYVIINGDLIEAVMPQAKNGTALFSGLFNNPDEQTAYVLRRLEPIKHKIIAICEGNHDHAITRWAGVEKLSGLAKALNVPYFTEAGGKVTLMVGAQKYTIYARHQHPGVSQISPSNSSRRAWSEFPDFENADVVVLSHLHFPDTHVTPRKGQDVVWLRSGTYKIMDSWAESRGFKPAYGVPLVVFSPLERRMVPWHGTLFPEAVEYLKSIKNGERISDRKSSKASPEKKHALA